MTLSFKKPFLHISCVLDFQQKDFKQIAKFLSSPILKDSDYSLSGDNRFSTIKIVKHLTFHSLENPQIFYQEFLRHCKKSFPKSEVTVDILFYTRQMECTINRNCTISSRTKITSKPLRQTLKSFIESKTK